MNIDGQIRFNYDKRPHQAWVPKVALPSRHQSPDLSPDKTACVDDLSSAPTFIPPTLCACVCELVLVRTWQQTSVIGLSQGECGCGKLKQRGHYYNMCAGSTPVCRLLFCPFDFLTLKEQMILNLNTPAEILLQY